MRPRDRVLVGRVIQTVEGAESALRSSLPANFGKLRSALRPMVGGDLSRVVFVSYGHPALRADGSPCAGGQAGFDVHPAFKLDGERLRQISNFTSARFLPQLKAIAQCAGGAACANPATDRMTFVDAHQQAFAGHGVCARSEQDPEFDRACFSADGKSFAASPVEGATEPLTCGRPVAEFRAYAPRARWIRTANDSYFVAMTYPEGLPSTQQPTDLHDATWGIISAVYGGAVHPTAEGHAAMADAALASARRVLGLAAQASVATEPLPPPPRSSDHRLTPQSSRHAELLLQAGRGGRVLKHEALVRIDVAVRLLRHQRDFVEAGQDQLELARIGVDVADREDAGNVGLERLGADRDQVVLQVDAPVGDRPELHGQAEERQDRVAGDVEVRAFGGLHDRLR